MDSQDNTIRMCRKLSREECTEVFAALVSLKRQSNGFEALIKSTTKCGRERFVEIYGFGDYFIDAITDIFMNSEEMELKFKPYGVQKEYKIFVLKKI